MPGNWTSIETHFPTFTDEDSMTARVDKLQQYMFILTEQLKYNLNNLDTSNWNSKALESFTSELSGGAVEKLAAIAGEIKSLSDTVSAVSGRLTAISQAVNEQGQLIIDLQTALSWCENDLQTLWAEVMEAGGLVDRVAVLEDWKADPGPKLLFTPDGKEPEEWEEGDWWATPEDAINEEGMA